MDSVDELPTLLLIGRGDPITSALEPALVRHNVVVEKCEVKDAATVALTAAPDLIVLLGDAVTNHASVVSKLGASSMTSGLPTALVAGEVSLEVQLQALRAGLAIVPRLASVDALASRLSELARDASWHGEGVGGEVSLREVVDLVQDALNVKSDSARVSLRPDVDDTIRDFVTRLKPLVDTSPNQELTVTSELATVSPHVATLDGLRVMLVTSDAALADEGAAELRARGATVVVVSHEGRGLSRARALNPSLIVLDEHDLSESDELLKKVRRDLTLRWASIVVIDLKVMLPDGQVPRVELLTGRLAPMFKYEEKLDRLAKEETRFEVQLEHTGPARLLRSLASSRKTFHVEVKADPATVEVDLAQGVIVAARAELQNDTKPLDGPNAVAALMMLAKGTVTVTERARPKAANLLMAVDDAVVAVDSASKDRPIDLPSDPPRGLVSLPSVPTTDYARLAAEVQKRRESTPSPAPAPASSPTQDALESELPLVPPQEPTLEAEEDPSSVQSLLIAVAATLLLSAGIGAFALSGRAEEPVPVTPVVATTGEPIVNEEVQDDGPSEPIARNDEPTERDSTTAMAGAAAGTAPVAMEATEPAAGTAPVAMGTTEPVATNADVGMGTGAADTRAEDTAAAEAGAEAGADTGASDMGTAAPSRAEELAQLLDEASQLRGRRMFAAASSRLDRARRLSPRSGKVLTASARLDIARGRGSDAVRWTRELTQRYPRAANYVLHGDALKAAGQTEGARRAWEHALRLNGNHRGAQRRLGR